MFRRYALYGPLPRLRAEIGADSFNLEKVMEKLCDGSRRPVRGKRHQVKTSKTGHMKATCPVCKRRLTVTRVLGVLEFPRHPARRPQLSSG